MSKGKHGKTPPPTTFSDVPVATAEFPNGIIAVTSIQSSGGEIGVVSADEARVLDKYYRRETLSADEWAQLVALQSKLWPPKGSKAGRRPTEARRRAQSLEVARFYICMKAVDPDRKKLIPDIAQAFGRSKSLVKDDISYARNHDGKNWWKAALADPRLEVWRNWSGKVDNPDNQAAVVARGTFLLVDR